MKIGILTLPLHTNYGGILQAYALQTVLERMGHEVVVIDKSRYKKVNWVRIILSIPFVYAKSFIYHRLPVYPLGAYSYNKVLNEKRIISIYTDRFIKEHIHHLHIKSFKDLKENDFDTIVVGSDQIWRAHYTRNLIGSVQDTFLRFAQKWHHLNRIAYAASFGTENWEYTNKETNDSSILIQLFNAISVREKTGIQLCEKRLDRPDAVHVLDPTLLLQYKDYEPLFFNKTIKSQGNMLCYVLDTTPIINKVIKEIAESRQLIPFWVGAQTNNVKLSLKERTQPPLEQWLQGFYDSDLIITDSFHACVFSIIFRKPFFVIGNKSRGMSRFDSLLSEFGLQDRMIDVNSLSKIDFNKIINYDKVYSILNKRREDSMKFLINSLNK